MRRFLVLLVVALGLSSPAGASDAVRCVQAQLNALGYGAGRADGQVGPATRAALDRYEGVAGVLTPRPLDRYSAIVHCRKLGQRHPAARAFWPSAGAPFTVIVTGDFRDTVRQRIEENLTAALSSLKLRHGVELAGRFTVVLGTSAGPMRKAARPYLREGFDTAGLERRLRNNCARPGISGVAVPGVFFVCETAEDRDSDPATAQDIQRVVRHEIFHEVQFQLRGVTLNASDAEYLRQTGPVWLIEGSAEVLAGVLDGHSSDPYLIASTVLAGKPIPDLRVFEIAGPGASADGLYVLGALAARELSDGTRGSSALVKYFEYIGDGLPWEKAFQRAFFRTPGGFYLEWDRLMKRPSP